jgi:catechol 2,3-dioxygenase-like lactoylglutathione lyase family enzyme
MELLSVQHVSLNVDDVERVGPFYVDTLGLTPVDRPDLGVAGRWFRCGDTEVHLIEVGTGHRAPDGQHLAFAVADIDRSCAELRAAGVEVTEVMDVGAGRQAFLSDPAGNLIELNQPAP